MMRARIAKILIVAGFAVLISTSAASAAAPAPTWKLFQAGLPTNLPPETEADSLYEVPEYYISAANVGGASTTGPTEVVDTLPPGTSPSAAAQPKWEVSGVPVETPGSETCEHDAAGTLFCEEPCEVAGQTVTCVIPPHMETGLTVEVFIPIEVTAAPGSPPVEDSVEVRGGGAPSAESSILSTISSEDAKFGFLPGVNGLSGGAVTEGGVPASAAGSHPFGMSFQAGFPLRYKPGTEFLASGALRDISFSLPPGVVADPSATPVRCTEAQLIEDQAGPRHGCPPASQVGTFSFFSNFFPAGGLTLPSALYNMVPPPGAAAEFAFNLEGTYVHIAGGLDGDFHLTGGSRDILAKLALGNVVVELWGDPSDPRRDRARTGFECATCSVEPLNTAFLTMPSACTPSPEFGATANSWQDSTSLSRTAAFGGPNSEPTSITGCNQLQFEPTISSQPTTNLGDSPSGLDVNIHQPQSESPDTNATAALEDATVKLPAGMTVNAAAAGGLGSCSEEQIGYRPEGGTIRFATSPQSCPNAAKIGTVQVRSPLQAEYTEEGSTLETDPESGRPVPRPLPGALYLAKPFANPLGSLLALYLVVEDPRSGIVVKLAGKVEPDPLSGQLTATFRENPQLPIEDVSLHIFNGARASLTTPLSCGTHTTTSDLTPWSTPEGQDAHPSDSFEVAGSCSASEGQAPNAPSFTAGTVSPRAGAYSPFVLKLHREDGSQRLTGIDTTLPPGVTGKLAGVQECSDAQIAAAQAREHPNMGQDEIDRPSCPSASEVGAVHVAAGSGPTPYWTSGHAYLAGPYKGAPLSLAAIVPAVAGPFDLGTVVTRVALNVDPRTAQIHAVSDPLPTILDGIPLDLRTVALEMGRPGFTLNPTSCDPMSVGGTATGAAGSLASLSSPFQVGGCSGLKFKPRMTLRLKGGTKRTAHPKLIATLYSQGAGAADLSRVQVKLPRSAFLDQAHIRTICTRVQFAAGGGNGEKCPAGSVYGHASVKTPLFDYTLGGKVYLRSSEHKLPDLVLALDGPANQPIAVEIGGRTDSVHGALRNTFEYVPDQPFEKATVVLFGGKRGLVVNSRNLCRQSKRASRANVQLGGQNGKVEQFHPLVRNSCKPAHKKRHKRHRPR